MISKEYFEKGMKEFHRERVEDEPDLINEVRNLLTDNGLSSSIENYNNNDMIVMASDKAPDVQRHFLNRYWSFQLANASAHDTFEARFSLIPNGPVNEWLRLFKEKVIPVCVKYNLPR